LWVREICAQESNPAIREALVALLLVESTARPLDARFVEWATRVLLLSVPLGNVRRRGRSLTVGPLQLRGGAWSRTAAVTQARTLLNDVFNGQPDVEALAACWNGRGPDGFPQAPYVRALSLVQPIAAGLLLTCEELGP